MEKELIIEGMMCNNCVRHVKEALGHVNGVSEVKVSLEGKNAKVMLSEEVSDETLKKAVEEEGYKVVEIK